MVANHSHGKGHHIIAFYGFRGGPGGVSNVMANLMNAVAQIGLAVDVLLNRTDIPELPILHPSIRLVELGEGGSVRRILHLARYLKREKPSVLLTNREPANRVAVVARMLSRVPTRLVFRVGMAISSALERRSRIKRAMRVAAMRYCYHRADVVVANAEDVARDIHTVTGVARECIHVIDNPTVDERIFTLAGEVPEHPWFSGTGVPVILGVGRLVRQKDFATLISAFVAVRKERPCRLVILGEGRDRPVLEKLIDSFSLGSDVSLPGFVANPFAYMRRADLFVLSSAWEGSPNVLIEALALGTPCISTDCPGGSRDILAGGRYGPLVPVGDVRAMSEAILQTLGKPPDRAVTAAAANRFLAPVCARRYLDAMGCGDRS
jgi:glycosyltransferase involved in cell wall biosynthesis